jgi:rRNA-processing protein EBP2
MAKIKDRLIFENKKIEAVTQRKSNKEQKLRAVETRSNKLMEKAKRKKDHFKELDDWAQSAASNRGRGSKDDSGDGPYGARTGEKREFNKKRQNADKKYGHGGKKGRFKQNDAKGMNDMSGFNSKGNFAAGTKKTFSDSGANRKGKRARDASRTRR